MRTTLRALVALCAASGAVTLGRWSVADADTPRDRLVAGLTRATTLNIDTPSVVFESTRPLALHDALRGRVVLFTAAASANGTRDVFRARVRVTPGGAVLGLLASANLTRSPLGDDGPLVAERRVEPGRARRFAYATRAFGGVQSVSVFDPSAGSGAAVGLRRRVSRWMERATPDGDARWDLRLDRPARSVSVNFDGPGQLRLVADDIAWRLDLPRDRAMPAEGLTVARTQEVDKPLIIWAVDTVRSLPFVGTRPIAWLEEHAFGLRDQWRRAAYRWWGIRPSAPPPEPFAPPDDGLGRALQTADNLDADDADWPPQRLAPPLGSAEGQEGQWVAAAPGFVRRLDGAPPAFYRTFLRLDRERPYARVHLVALDMRQMEIGMQAGVEDPVPLVGPRGDGRIPRRPELLGRVVGAFNGAFKTEHGAYGMVVDRRVLLPPRPRGATVASFDDGSVALGTWGASQELPPGLRSLRQNLDPLVADGVENPTRRALWGFVLGGIETMPTVRSGLCADLRGRLVYVWGEETTGRQMARAMRLAGCTYGLHLDMNPTHASFHFLRVEDVARRQFQYQPLVSTMHSHGDRFLYYTLKDFFYLALRPTAPAPWPGAQWSTEALPQSPPRWMPSVHRAEVPFGEGRRATVIALDLRRIGLALRAGRQEPALRSEPLGAPATTLPAEAASGLLGAWELGVSRDRARPRGVRVEGRDVLPFGAEADAGWLGLGTGGALTLGAGTPGPEVTMALGGTLLVAEARATTGSEMTDAGALPRRAFGRGADGRLYFVSATCRRAELTALLLSAGLRDAVELTGVTGSDALHWRGGAEPLHDAYPGTTLFLSAVTAPSPVTRLEPRLTDVVAPGATRH